MIVGIDLGTTFSAVATLGPAGRPVALPNRLGELTTPSVVYFESASSVLVGAAARDAAGIDPDNGIALIKRQMGNAVELLYHGISHTPESISALILRSLVDDALAHNASTGPVRAVITVPAYFGIREREATLQAARLAGIEVLELLSEPVAAALHYGATGSRGAILVYDLGGGTFDTTVLRVEPDGARVVATDGDSQLGGADWDARIADFLLESFVRAAGGVDVEADADFPQRIARAAETAKRALSAVTSRPVQLRSGGVRVTVELDRETLDRLGSDLVERTASIVERVLASASSRGVRRVEQVILVGGSSRLPSVSAVLARRLGIAPRLIEPDLAVVFGAAIRAAQLVHTGAASTRSVVPRSFGVLLEDSHDPSGSRRFVAHTVHQNQPLPAEATTPFCTIVNGQNRIRLQVYEQAGDVPSEEVEHNRRVLDCELTNLPALPAGSRIDVTLRVDTDGLLSVIAAEPGSGTVLSFEAYVDGVVDGAAVRSLGSTLTGLTVRQ